MPNNEPIKLTAKYMRDKKTPIAHYCKVSHLGQYGFDDQIMAKMQEFEIFPQLFEWGGDYYVYKNDLFGVVRHFMISALQIYMAVAEKDALADQIASEINPEAVPISYDDLDKVARGEAKLDEIIASKQADSLKESPTNYDGSLR